MDNQAQPTTEEQPQNAVPDAVSGLLSLEELIKNHIEGLEKLKLELKAKRDMLKDGLNNNPTYREEDQKVKDVQAGRNAIRQQIMKQPSMALLEQEVKDLNFDKREKAKTLSDLLQDYSEQVGATEIETRTGQVLRIVRVFKVSPGQQKMDFS